MSILLIKTIIELFLSMLAGWGTVKCRLLKSKDSQPLSVLALYLVTPCVILNSFQIEYTDEIKDNLILAFALAIMIHFVLVIFTMLIGRLFYLNAIEKSSIMYSNAGNLIVPIVISLFGNEYVIYSSAFMAVQLILLWSHARITISEEKNIDFRKIFLNVNMICIAVGLLLFVFQIQLPDILTNTMDSIGGMIGTISMIVAGMLIANMDIKTVLSYKRLPLITILRMIICPLMILILLRLIYPFITVPQKETIITISLLASITPTAATITQMSQVYGKDSRYASAIYAITTILCIITMPIMIQIFIRLIS